VTPKSQTRDPIIFEAPYNGVTILIFWGSRDVIGHVTIRLPGLDFLWVVHNNHASVEHLYGDIAV